MRRNAPKHPLPVATANPDIWVFAIGKLDYDDIAGPMIKTSVVTSYVVFLAKIRVQNSPRIMPGDARRTKRGQAVL